MKALVDAFNQEKALVGAFSVIVKTGCETDGSCYNHYYCCPLPRPGLSRPHRHPVFAQMLTLSHSGGISLIELAMKVRENFKITEKVSSSTDLL